MPRDHVRQSVAIEPDVGDNDYTNQIIHGDDLIRLGAQAPTPIAAQQRRAKTHAFCSEVDSGQEQGVRT